MAPAPAHASEAAASCLLVHAAHAVLLETGGWLNGLVELRWLGEGRGCGIVATGLIARGTQLLRTGSGGSAILSSQRDSAGEAAAFQGFLESVQQEPESGSFGSAQLVLRLLYLLLRLGRGLGSGTALEKYIEAIPELEDAPELWTEEAALGLRGSAIFPRVTAAAKQNDEEVVSLAAAWPAGTLVPPPSPEELGPAYRRAKALVSSRGLNADKGVVICPVLDLVNHAGPDYTSARYSVTGEVMHLWASQDIAPGSEVCICYDRDADYLDIWERYGFFDSTAWIHTAEILISQEETNLIEAGAYWIPEHRSPLDCPLLSLLRAERQAHIGSSLSQEEAEMSSLKNFAGLIRAHLDAYPEASDAQAVAGEQANNILLALRLRAAGSVIAYEKELLSRTLAKLEGILSAAG